jgi:hypothetical protein
MTAALAASALLGSSLVAPAMAYAGSGHLAAHHVDRTNRWGTGSR